jgi:hypothetical protein
LEKSANNLNISARSLNSSKIMPFNMKNGRNCEKSNISSTNNKINKLYMFPQNKNVNKVYIPHKTITLKQGNRVKGRKNSENSKGKLK